MIELGSDGGPLDVANAHLGLLAEALLWIGAGAVAGRRLWVLFVAGEIGPVALLVGLASLNALPAVLLRWPLLRAQAAIYRRLGLEPPIEFTHDDSGDDEDAPALA